MAVFNVSGKINLGGEERPFSKKVEAASENMARHKIDGGQRRDGGFYESATCKMMTIVHGHEGV